MDGTFTDFADPLAQTRTFGLGIDGQYVVGTYGIGPEHGFLYNYQGAAGTPEPASAALACVIGAAALIVWRRKRFISVPL